ncbi:MAG: flagellar basal body P-ring formation protein FlgA [Planctomycetaceae bacterium]|nr:flagellar basal body P-ring formation protein FlgA [Planctomycetaceae bacterium]
MSTRCRQLSIRRLPAHLAAMLLLLAGAGPSVLWGEDVVISLRSDATVTTELVRIGDCADVSATSGALAEQIRNLDVDQFETESTRTIPRQQIELRLRLFGLGENDVRVEGAKSVEVTRTTIPTRDVALEMAITSQMVKQYSLTPDQIRVRLMTSVENLFPSSSQEDLDWDVLLPGAVPFGRHSLLVRGLSNGRVVGTRQVSVDIQIHKPLVVANRDLPAGYVITESDIEFGEYWCSDADTSAALVQVISSLTARPIKKGEPVKLRDLKTVDLRDQFVVRQRDSVSVVARSGALTITLQAAEAMQNGKVGDRIWLRNLDSKRLISGVITAPGVAEIDLSPTAGIRTADTLPRTVR